MRDCGLIRRYVRFERVLPHPCAPNYCVRQTWFKQVHTGKSYSRCTPQAGLSSTPECKLSQQGSLHVCSNSEEPFQDDNWAPPGHQAVLSVVSRALSCRVDCRCFLASLRCARDIAAGIGKEAPSSCSSSPSFPSASPRELSGLPWGLCLSPSPRQTVDSLSRYLFQQEHKLQGLPAKQGLPLSGMPIYSTTRPTAGEMPAVITTAEQNGAYGRILQQWVLTPLRDCVQYSIQYATLQPPPDAGGKGGLPSEDWCQQAVASEHLWDESAAAAYLVEVLSHDVFRKSLYQKAWREASRRHTTLLARVDLLFASSQLGKAFSSTSLSSAVDTEAELISDNLNIIKEELFGIPHSVVEAAVPQIITLERAFRDGATHRGQRSPLGDLHCHSPSRYITQRSMYAFYTNSTTLTSKLGRPPTHLLLCTQQPLTAKPSMSDACNMLWILLYEMVQLRILCAVLLQVGLLLWCVHRTHQGRVELESVKNAEKGNPCCKSSLCVLSTPITPHSEPRNHLLENVLLDEVVCAWMAASLASTSIADLLQPRMDRLASKFSQNALVIPWVPKEEELFEMVTEDKTQRPPEARGAMTKVCTKNPNYSSVQALYKYISSRLRSIELNHEAPHTPTERT
ncbi:unnamed protein product [Phytomonas sp. Hart1]|nr:unnamed protein product [Phytomonas sp. Hart1]|eukprot:CCW71981.1 unnamed protein product [Phytomonas sp. isolate Hart1]